MMKSEKSDENPVHNWIVMALYDAHVMIDVHWAKYLHRL